MTKARVYPMQIVCGWKRETLVPTLVTDLGCGVGMFACLECEGTGDWSRFHPEPETLTEPLPCVDCKGTGKQYCGL